MLVFLLCSPVAVGYFLKAQQFIWRKASIIRSSCERLDKEDLFMHFEYALPLVISIELKIISKLVLVCSCLECSSFTAFVLLLIYDWHQIEYFAPRADHSQHLTFFQQHLPFLFRQSLSLLLAFLLFSEISLPPVQDVLLLLKFWANIDGGHLFGGVLDNLCDFCVIYGELVAYRDFRAGCGVATDPVAMPADANALIFLLETQRQALAVAYALHPQSRIIFVCRSMVLKRMVASLRAERIRA